MFEEETCSGSINHVNTSLIFILSSVPRGWLVYIFGRQFVFMACLFLSFQIRVHSSLPNFGEHFWGGTHVHLSTSFHPQTNGQPEHTIQVLEDMLQSCDIEFGGQWDQFLPLVEFPYNNNNNNQASIQMDIFKALYGRRCRSPLGWFESTKPMPYNTNFLQDALHQMRVIHDKLRTAHSRHQSYMDQRRRQLRFVVCA